MKDKKRITNIIAIVFLVVGTIMCSLPLGLRLYSEYENNKLISSFESESKKIDVDKINEAFEKAEEYNKLIAEYGGNYVFGLSDNGGILSNENYERLLNLQNNGIMGTIEIPKINSRLAIKHGTSDEVLATSIGHVYESSLPIGGNNTRVILTGHRGLANAELFSRLDELKNGDIFYIKVLNRNLAYQINEIEVLTPEEAAEKNVVPNKDLVSLMTCTPYGINSHRLFITGERISLDEIPEEIVKVETNINIWEQLIYLLPVLGIDVILIIFVVNKKNHK